MSFATLATTSGGLGKLGALLNLPSLGRRSPIGLDVGARQVKAVQLEHIGPRRAAAGRTSASPHGQSAGATAEWRIVAAAVAPRQASGPVLVEHELATLPDLLYRSGFQGDRVVIAAPGSALLQGVLELPPRSSNAPIEQIARLELARAHRCQPDSFEMGCWDLPTPRAAKATQVMAVGFPHAMADAMLDAFESAHLTVEAIDVRPCALARACAPALAPAGMTAVIDLGWETAELSLLHHGSIVYGRTLAESGVGTLREALVHRLGIEADVADYLLTDVGLCDDADAPDAPAGAIRRSAGPVMDLPDDARAMLSIHVEALARELEVSFTYASHQYSDTAVTKLLLVGGGAAIPGLAAHLAPLVRMEVAAVSPASLAVCDERLLQSSNSPALTLAMGLAQFSE